MFALIAFTVSLASEGTSSPAPPRAPTVDFTSLPDSANVRSTDRAGKLHPVRARLITEGDATPGGVLHAGLHLEQAAGWHTYWKSPGEIGLPTGITWTLPDGWTAAAHTYPAPQRFEVEQIVSFGYDDQVLLTSDITVPPDAEPGNYVLKAEAEWLVCETSCIPGNATLELPVTVGAGPSTPWAPLFSHYAAQHPRTAAELGLTATITTDPIPVAHVAPFTATLRLSGPEPLVADVGRFPFAPIVGDNWMILEQSVSTVDGAIVATLKAETLVDTQPSAERIGGLFQLLIDGKPVSVEVVEPLAWAASAAVVPEPETAAALTPAVPAEAPFSAPPPAPSDVTLLSSLFFAFLGGLILNIMPCVLPVLTLKLYSLIEQSDITPKEQRTAGLAYTGGILFSFLVLAITVLVLRSVMDVGWGFQFQYPPYVAGLAAVVFAFALSLFGVFEIPAVGTGTASEASSKEGPLGYFFTGVFATLLATPCSAPILGSATAFTLSASTPELILVYLLIGLGLAAPFLAIAFIPALYKVLPRPGAWMDTFKQVLGFTLLATTLWLVGVLGTQIGFDRLWSYLVFLTFVAGGCWVFGHFGGVAATLQRQLVAGLAGALLIGVGGFAYLDLAFAEEACDSGETTAANQLDFSEHIPWQPFTEERVQALAGTPVFIDFTAEWCVSCKVNERVVLETAGVREAMKANGVVPLKADWTKKDPVITKWLTRYNKAGVPFYLVLPANGEPIPLGEVITPGSVNEALKKASGT